MDVVGQLQAPGALFPASIKQKVQWAPAAVWPLWRGQFLVPFLEFSFLRPVAYDVYLGDLSGSQHNSDYCFPRVVTSYPSVPGLDSKSVDALLWVRLPDRQSLYFTD